MAGFCGIPHRDPIVSKTSVHSPMPPRGPELIYYPVEFAAKRRANVGSVRNGRRDDTRTRRGDITR